MPTPLKIAVCGASGRTGSRAAALAAGDPRFHLLARVDRGRAAQFEDEVGACGAGIDFSAPAAIWVRWTSLRPVVPLMKGTLAREQAAA